MWHQKVEKEDIRLQHRSESHRLSTIRRFPDERKLRFALKHPG
jgi:hypothetical protein